MKQAITIRKCPKCGGNLFLDHDYYIEGIVVSWYEEETCLQCGYIKGVQLLNNKVIETTNYISMTNIKELALV